MAKMTFLEMNTYNKYRKNLNIHFLIPSQIIFKIYLQESKKLFSIYICYGIILTS
jgi:hypothetical protein